MAHEDRAGMANPVHQCTRFLDRQLKVFGRDAVGDDASLVEIGYLNQRTATVERGGDDVLARHGRQEPFNAGGDAIKKRRIGTKQNRLRQLVVFGLGEEVDRRPVRIARAVGDDQHFRRAGDHVDADGAEDAALGAGDVRVARTDDLVDLRNCLRAIGQRSHSLRAADREYPIDAGQMRRREHQLIPMAAGRWHNHDEFFHARHLGGNGVHQHGARIGRLAAGDVEADAIQRRDLLAQPRAVGFGVFPRLGDLPLVVNADSLGGVPQ